jgi:hypothetical protein
MGNDDKLDQDPDAGKIDAPTFAQRFQRVADIVTRANTRFDRVKLDPGPINDPAVIVALQAIQTQCNTLLAKVVAALPPGTVAGP